MNRAERAVATRSPKPAQAARTEGRGGPSVSPLNPCPKAAKYPGCPGHNPKLCDAHVRSGKGDMPSGRQCRRGRGHGTDHPGYGNCMNHGGSSPGGRAGAQREAAVGRLAMLGVSIKTDWRQALREQISEAVGNVTFLRQECQALGLKLIGDVVSDTRDGTLYATREEARAIVRLYNEERDRLVRFCKVAADVGFAEAEIELAKQQGQLLAIIVFEVLDGLALPPAKITEARQLLGLAFRHHAPSLATAELS